ncbi:cysteine desulfurase [Carnobacteriaceae bacterium zg-ZUI252]|nr:cysteine desulfurase [Carnobacteriaceae bacterium zg-ZUI252]MBS4770542.1 cysteine desulfurase [Carnobacteriaceae bacterium zg-ZUI240]QTU82588.1 cysteine desulfurase [Carnobacteriaceae bacterium zg-C25]
MSFQKQVTILGRQKTYTISPKCKRYTLRDNGFEETKTGNFQFVRSLDVVGGAKKHLQLKVTISKNMDSLKISTTNQSGLSTVDLYKMKNNEMIIEKFEFILDGLVDRDVLIELN